MPLKPPVLALVLTPAPAEVSLLIADPPVADHDQSVGDGPRRHRPDTWGRRHPRHERPGADGLADPVELAALETQVVPRRARCDGPDAPEKRDPHPLGEGPVVSVPLLVAR